MSGAPRFKPDRADGKPRTAKATVRFTEGSMRVLEQYALKQGVCVGDIVRQAVAAAGEKRIGPFSPTAQKGKVLSL